MGRHEMNSLRNFRRVSKVASANAALVLRELEKLEEYSRWGAAPKNKSKKPWPSVSSLCRRAGGCPLLRSHFLSRVYPLSKILGCTPKGSTIRQHSVLRRVLRRFWKGIWGRVLRRGPAMGFTVKKGSEKGSQKGF